MDISELTRRGFLELAGAGVLGALGGRAIAGPFFFDPEKFPVPADKKFDPAWIESLTARGAPLTATRERDELRHIGMPIGGIGCGQVYLSGDGRLWCWDIFNQPPERVWSDSSGPLYAKPAEVSSSFVAEVSIRRPKEEKRTLDARGFRSVTFTGRYPIAEVAYEDKSEPVKVSLEAFSPFVPLNTEESSLPCTILRYRFTNTGAAPTTFDVNLELENPVALKSGEDEVRARRFMQFLPEANGLIVCRAMVTEHKAPERGRPDIVIADFEGGSYGDWKVEGTAFGTKPRTRADLAAYQGDVGAVGDGFVNTHQTRAGEDVHRGDAHTGTLTSPEFTIERAYLSFRVGGGSHAGATCVELLVDGEVVKSTTGRDSNAMRDVSWAVFPWRNKKASIRIIDRATGAWGNIGADHFVLTNHPRTEPYDTGREGDYGSFTASVLSPRSPLAQMEPAGFRPGTRANLHEWLTLGPGESEEVIFLLCWHFPNVNREQLGFITGIGSLKRHYAARFADAADVARYVHANAARLMSETRLWVKTWYDSTLPYWFLDRSFATIACAATSTCVRFDNGRFYGWEGTHCCPGTCTHVWQYAQGLARIFPELERSLRRDIDFGAEFNEETGLIHYRGEAARSLAIDGHCGTIVRAWREHTMCPDDSFLRAVYPRVRKAMELVIARDTDADGILDGEQYNTLDTSWYGRIAWISSLYGAALRAAAAMARDAGDREFAARCDAIADSGMKKLTGELFNGEYFVHKTDPARPDANSTGPGCHIDQVLGQSFAWQTGLARVTEAGPTIAALRSLYRYNFAPDIGPYRAYAEKIIKGGRWYAMPGEGGLLMCTWPNGGSESATGKSGDAWAAGYFNECMTGFEHQAASHMIAEGLVQEGLAVTRMIHDRYHPRLRNPYNEVECSNHYARAMASYGSFVAACGFKYHGPRAEIEFMPRLGRAHFRAAFVGAEGWGAYEQLAKDSTGAHTVRIAHGALKLARITVPAIAPAARAEGATVRVNGADQACARATAPWDAPRAEGFASLAFTFDPPLSLRAGDVLEITTA